MGNRYIEQFLNLKCAGDVMNTCFPILKPEKEITESMAVIRLLKKLVIQNPMEYHIVDLCAGNALTSVLSVFMLPIRYSLAIDKRERERRWYLARRFSYMYKDIYELTGEEHYFNKKSIIISVHPCANLANKVIEIYKNSEAQHLILVPCCQGVITKVIPPSIQSLIHDNYKVWVWQLAEECGGKFIFDTKCISAKNGIIIASKLV